MKWWVHHSSVWSKWVWLYGELSSIMEIPRVVAKWKNVTKGNISWNKTTEDITFPERSFRLSSENENQVNSLNYTREWRRKMWFSFSKGRWEVTLHFASICYHTTRKERKLKKTARDIRREWIERMTNSEDKFSMFKTNWMKQKPGVKGVGERVTEPWNLIFLTNNNS